MSVRNLDTMTTLSVRRSNYMSRLDYLSDGRAVLMWGALAWMR